MDAAARPHAQPPDAPVTVRVDDPGEIAAALPQLLGFRPRESIVLVALTRPDGGRLGLTVRMDIPPPRHAAAVARALTRAVRSARPRGVVLAVVSDEDDVGSGPSRDLPHRPLVAEVLRALPGVAVPWVLLVRGGRWWCYDCPDSCCDPGAGTALPSGRTALAAAAVATGVVVAEDRADLAQRIARPSDFDRAAMVAACVTAASARADAVVASGWDAASEDAWTAITAAVERCRPGGPGAPLADDEVARILWALRDTGVRDRALELALGPDAAAAEVLWTECTRRALTPLDAAPATLLAVSAWLRGDGAMANVALDRALDGQPDYVLAGLLAEGLARCLPPADLRAMIRATLGSAADDGPGG